MRRDGGPGSWRWICDAGNYRRLAQSPGSSLAVLGVLFSVRDNRSVSHRSGNPLPGQDRGRQKPMPRALPTILAEHTALTFEDVDRVLQRAASRFAETTCREISISGMQPNAALRGLQKSSSILVAIGWTDASGEVIAHSYDHAPPRRNISDMPHFIAQRDSSDDRLFIAPPYRSAAGDKWFTAASRRLSNADGSFAGIVTAPLDQSYFTKIYRSIDLGKDGSVLLLHREGQILAREPERKDSHWEVLRRWPAPKPILPVSETGAYETTSVVDGVPRIAGYKAVPGLPLVLVVSYARSDVLRPWYRHLYDVRSADHCDRLHHIIRHISAGAADQRSRGQDPGAGANQ